MEFQEFDDMIGASREMKNIFSRIEDVAELDIPVLIMGESGTGKELVANSIHRRSSREDGPFIPVNTGAFSTELLMTELFGHEKGAFTGANKQHRGLFEIADGGSLFLDEISTMDMKTQVALLRVLETRRFQRVGSSHFISVNVRIIAATNENLRRKIRAKQFRRDLFHRLNVFSIFIPPLRKRKADIEVLADIFIRKYAEEFDKQVAGINDEAKKLLYGYPWPGNVRELENTIMQLIISLKGDTIGVESLPGKITRKANYKRRFRIRFGKPLNQVEAKYIEETLKEYNGNKEQTARSLGISRKTLYNKIQKLGIEIESGG